MNEKFLDNIIFQVDGLNFSTQNIVFEHFNRVIPKHSHSDKSYEIHYIAYGYGNAVIDGTEYQIIPNTLYVTGPNVEHEQIPAKTDPMAEYCIYFNIHGHGRPDSVISDFVQLKSWFGIDTQNIHATIRELFFELQNRNCGYTIQAEALLKQLIVKVIRNYKSCNETKTRHTNLNEAKFLTAEESFLYNYSYLTLEQLASRLGLGIRQTERFLQEHYGKSFLKKRTESRMSTAASMLSQSNKSIASISEELGYSSSEHFSHAFKKQYNISPGKFRKVNKSDG